MALSTFRGVVENGQIRLEEGVSLPENATVYVVVTDTETKRAKPIFDLEEMISRMPADYQVAEEDFGPPIGKEVW